MNHSLSVYTVIYLSIIFVTVSIFSSGIANSEGDLRLLIFAQGAFSLKIAIDDYIHFHKSRTDVYLSLNLSLLIYILLATSIAQAASGNGRIASLLFSFVFFVGCIWILLSEPSRDERKRRDGWLTVNWTAFLLLLLAAFMLPEKEYSLTAIPLCVLIALIVTDFFYFGTLRRLAEIQNG
jgi:hypothetical protein